MKLISKYFFGAISILSLSLISNNVSHAQALSVPEPTGDIGGFFDQLSAILGLSIKLIIGIAIVLFLWGVVTYVISGSQEDKAKGRSYMIWGLIGLFVMVSVWAIITLFTDTFFTELNNAPPAIPTL